MAPYTPGLREVMRYASQEAFRLGHSYVGPDHYLLGIIRKGDGMGAKVLLDMHVDLRDLGTELESLLGSGGGPGIVFPTRNESAKRVMTSANNISRQMGHTWLGTGHLLLALLREENTQAAKCLKKFGVDFDGAQEIVKRMIEADTGLAVQARDLRATHAVRTVTQKWRDIHMEDLKKFIRDVPDFPKPGIMFKDITPLLGNGDAFRKVIGLFAGRYEDRGIQKIVGVEARGLIFAGALAYRLGVGMVPARKPGKLPYKTISETYELEYGTDSLEIHEDAIQKGEKVVVLDDVLATGGTISAVCRLVDDLGGEVVEVATLIELGFLNGREKLKDRPYYTILTL